MANPIFHIKAVRDEEAGVYWSKSDIAGLHIEGETFEEFEQLAEEFAAELILENHLDLGEMLRKDLRDRIPVVILTREDGGVPAAGDASPQGLPNG